MLDPNPPAGRSVPGIGRQARIQQFLSMAPLALFALLAWSNRWIEDDGYIYMRIAKQIVAGNGPVFNRGERVESYTSAIWVALLAILDVFTPIRLEWIAVLAGIALSVAALYLAARAASALWPTTSLRLPVGLLVLVALPPMWAYASSGLETGLSFAWLGYSLFVLARWANSDDYLGRGAAVVLGIGILVRPEMIIVTTIVLATVIFQEGAFRSVRRLSAMLGWAFTIPIAYQIFRMGYFGSVVAMPAIAKEGTRPYLTFGWRYLADFTFTYWFWIPVLLLIVGALLPLLRSPHPDSQARRRRSVVAAFVVSALVMAAYFVVIGGDYLHARLLLPSAFALCAPFATVPFERAYRIGYLALIWAATCLFVLRPASGPFTSRGYVKPFRAGVGAAQNFFGHRHLPKPTEPGVYTVDRVIRPGGLQRLDLPPTAVRGQPIVILFAMGAAGYDLGINVRILDPLGLADPLTAHLQIVRRAYPGHEKPLPRSWMAARTTQPGTPVTRSTFPVVYTIKGYELAAPSSQTAFAYQVAFARLALQCPAIRRLNDAAVASMSVSRFFTNLVDSPSNTSMRIPPEPAQAYEKFCKRPSSR